jgi:hypothetical protein
MEMQKDSIRGALIPTAAGIVGGGIGLVLTRKPNGRSPGDLAGDLLGKVESVVGGAKPTQNNGSSRAAGVDGAELAKRRQQREERRASRRSGR